jgi:hypothetical protein
MNDFEKQIRDALARKEPSPGFEARVLAAAGRTEERRNWWQFPFVGRMRWASAVVATVTVVTAVAWRHERAVEDRAAGEAAKARLELALKITSVKLARIQQRVEAHESN